MKLTRYARLVMAMAVGAVLALPAGGAAARGSVEIAFMCGRSTLDLCLVHPDGTGRRQLTRGDAVRNGAPFGTVSRGASLLAFIHRDLTIRVRTLGGRRVARILTGLRDPYTVELDRAGRRLLYTDVGPFGSTSVCRLQIGSSRPHCFQSFRSYHAWGPGGTVISTESEERSDICVERPRNHCARRIARTGPGGSFFGPAAMSPDGGRLAVIEDLPAAGETRSRVVTFSARTGRRLRVLTTGHRDMNPAWSPDGRWIAFDRDAVIRAPRLNTQIVFASLWRVPSRGGDARRVTRRGYQPAWAS